MKKLVQSTFSNPDSFKNIIRLARYICQTDTAMMNYFDDQHRHTLFSENGKEEQVPVEDTICKLTLGDEDFIYIPDTNEDSRLKEIEAVRENEQIRFYAGVGITAPDGTKGTLCVIDDEPGKLTEEQKEGLKTLATEIEAKLEFISVRETLQKKDHLLRTSADIGLVLNPETLIIEDSHGEVEQYLEYTHEELEGTVLADVIVGAEFMDQLNTWKKKKQPEVFTSDTNFISKSGELIDLKFYCSVADDKLYMTARNINEPSSLSTEIIENMPGIFCVVNKDGEILRMNKRLASVTGYETREIKNSHLGKILTSESTEIVNQMLGEIFDGQSAKEEVLVSTKEGAEIPFLFSGFYQELEGEDIGALIGIDISEEKEALKTIEDKEKVLRSALERLTNAQQIAKLGNWEYDIENDEFSWSDETQDIMQLEEEHNPASIDVFYDRLPDDDKPKLKEFIHSATNGEDVKDLEHDMILPDGSLIHVYERGKVEHDENGKPVKLFGTIQDITRQKKTESELKEALESKQTLMKEIHHRVKNNLAIVAGMLQLESTFVDDSKSYNALIKSITRIKSMAALHEQLYTSENFKDISFGDYIRELVSVIEFLHEDRTKDIEVRVNSDDIKIDIDQAIPCALILNELLTNSYKYAFEDREKGTIEVNLTKDGDEILMKVEDDGIGIFEHETKKENNSFGLKLLETLSKQLDAEYNIESENGTTIEIRFEKK